MARLRDAFLARRPGRAELITDSANAALEDSIARFVDDQVAAGVAYENVPDAFYLYRRMATWAAPTHGAVEFARDTTSPLWSTRLLPAMLGGSPQERELEMFHLRVLEVLAPELVDVPFADGKGWPSEGRSRSRGVAGAMTTGRKAVAAVRRRVAPGSAPSAEGPGTDDQVAATQSLLRDRIPPPEDPHWETLDRAAVLKLLARDPRSLDTLERYRIWRLASVFLA